MTESGKFIEIIIKNLNILRSEITSKSNLGLLNLNTHCENLIRDILNITYDLSLSNLNDKTSNFPGIDLGDFQNKVAYQITSTKTAKKIDDTLKICLKKKHFEHFDQINIFILTAKQNSYSIKSITAPSFKFDTNNIIDFDDLYKSIRQLPLTHLSKLHSLIRNELPEIVQSFNEQNIASELDPLPILDLKLETSFSIELEQAELQVFLKEVHHRVKNNLLPYFSITILEEKYFHSLLKKLRNMDRTLENRETIVDLKDILQYLSELKIEIYKKIEILFKSETYPLSEDFAILSVCTKELVESLSYPQRMVEETTISQHYKTQKKANAKKFDGDIKFDVFKDHESGRRLGCSIYLTKEEIIELKNRNKIFSKIDDDTFFKKDIWYFSFSSMSFTIETLAEKVIPSFVDKFYDFRGPHYNFIDKDDFTSWVDLTNYNVALA